MEGARQGPPASASRRPGPGSRPRSFKTECVVLRSRDMREADRLVTLLTPAMGKLTVTVRGARKTTSRLGGHLDVLNRANLTLALGHRIDVVTGAESLETFGGVKADLERLALGLYFMELGDALLPLESPHPAALRGAARRASRARGRHSVRGGPALRRAAAARRRRLPARAAALPRVRQGGRASLGCRYAATASRQDSAGVVCDMEDVRRRHTGPGVCEGDAPLESVSLGAQGAPEALRRAWVRGRGLKRSARVRLDRALAYERARHGIGARRARCNIECWSGRWRRPVSWSTVARVRRLRRRERSTSRTAMACGWP